jgi:hypothetical protein
MRRTHVKERRPPRAAEWLLRLCCPRRDRVFVLGDLEAEYELRGGDEGWYWRQAVRSAGALMAMGARRGDWEYGLFAVMLATAGPALLIPAWWSLLLSQVPLKVDIVRGADFAAVSLGVTALLCAGAGIICTLRGLVWALPAAWAFALLGQAAANNLAPAWFGAANVITITFALAAGAWLRRIFDGGHLA